MCKVLGREKCDMKKGTSISLSPLFSDGMIFQRNSTTKVFGNAGINEEIVICFNGKNYKAIADDKGEWQVFMDIAEAGGPFTMEVKGLDNDKLVVKDILIGDLWICSGQSNMEIPIRRTLDLYADEISKVDCKYIRQFKMPQVYDFIEPQTKILSSIFQRTFRASSHPDSK